MTMQFALQAQRRTVVLASDTKIRTTDKVFTNNPYTPEGMIHHGKIVISKRHDIAIALAGSAGQDEDPAQELADHLSSQDTIPDSIGSLLITWGNEYFQRKCPGQKHDFPMHTLLVVNPKTEYSQFWRVRVGHKSSDQASSKFIMNGQDRSPVVFWPEYFKCDEQLYDPMIATRIAAFTILMASQLNPYGVGGLEIWQYDGAWKSLSPGEIEQLTAQFQELQESIRSAVHATTPVGSKPFRSVLGKSA